MTTDPKEPASPACFAHEADAAYMGFATRAEIAGFLEELRKADLRHHEAMVSRLRQMLPKVRNDALYRDLADMLRSHEANIARASKALEAK